MRISEKAGLQQRGDSMVICILGGVGSGKSEVLRIFREKYDALIIQADLVAHQLYEAGRPGYEAIGNICGKEYLNEESVDRKKLSAFLLDHPEYLPRINEAIHPMVYRDIADTVTANPNRLIIEEQAVIPETRPGWMEKVWYIHSSPEIRRKRLKETRGYSDEKTDSIIAKQPSEEEYRRFSDVIIENNGNLNELEEQIDENIKYCQRQQR